MDEMRARMRDRRLQRRARDARDAPPPPPDARGEDPPAGPGSSHDDDFSASDADAALPSRAPRGFGAGTTARAGSALEELLSAPSSTRGGPARSGTDRSDRAFSPPDDDRAFSTETAESYDAALRGLEADRRALREEVLRVRRVDREREEAARFERARRIELEREVARLRGGDERKGETDVEIEATREQMRATLAAVDAAARERDDVAREIQTELEALQMERLKLSAAAKRVSRGERRPERDANGAQRDSHDDSAERTAALERQLAEERRSRKVEQELRGELETVAARLAEAVGVADETDRAARREMGEALSAARRDARRAAEAETEALRFGARAEDAEATCAKLREQLRLLAERRAEASKAEAEAEAKASGGLGFEPRVMGGVSDEKSEDAASASLRAELVGLREDLARETSLAKSALREADEANRARDESLRRLEEKQRELESLSSAAAAAKAEETARMDAARDAARLDASKRDDELAEARAAMDDVRLQLADALADLDAVSREKKRLAEALALETKTTRDAREEAERLARELADERESFRRRLREARDELEAREAKHRLEKAEWEDATRAKRRERYALSASSGTSRTVRGEDRPARGTTAEIGEGVENLGVGVGDASETGDARRDADAGPTAAAKAEHSLPEPPRPERAFGSDDTVPARLSPTREGRARDSFSVPDRPPPPPRPAYAPNGFPLPKAEPPVSFAAPSRVKGTVPVPVPVPGPSEYDRYLDSLPPSPIAGPPPPPPPGRTRGRGDALPEPATRFWRERPVRPR